MGPKRVMFRGPSLVFPVRALRDAKPLADRQGWWAITGPRPEFELQTADRVLPDSWALISFNLSREGPRPSYHIIALQPALARQRLILRNGGHLRALIRLRPAIQSIRILLGKSTGAVSLGTIRLRPISKAQAGFWILTGCVGARPGGWRNLPARAATAVKLLARHGPAAVLAPVAKHHLFTPNLGLVPLPAPTKLDLFNDGDVTKHSGVARESFIWIPQAPSAIDDLWSAARFCIDLLRTRADLRERFPDALSAGPSGAFAGRLSGEGAALFGLSSTAREAIRSAFAVGLANQVRQIFLMHDDLRTELPLALTPAGHREFFHWMIHYGRKLHGVRLEMIWWFFLEAAENPALELVRTFLFTPEWQRQFPDGVTAFGRGKLAAWLAESYRLDADWLDAGTWPMIGTAAEHLRLAYTLRGNWQREHPGAFKTLPLARAFLSWIASPACGLTGDALAWCTSLDKEAVARELVAGGVNIVGHFCFPSGLRTSVRSISKGLSRAGLGLSFRDIWQGVGDEPQPQQFQGLEIYDTTIIHTQPEPFFDAAYSRSGLQPRHPRTYRIGYWYWEFDEVPASWKAQATQVDELWTATNFVADAMRKRFDVPVFKMMPGFELPHLAPRPRSAFGLPEDKFIFMFVFHMMSVMERKNPLALIKAYRQAFGHDNRVLLILKTSFGGIHPDPMGELSAAAAGTGIEIIDAIYTEDDTLSLMAHADCYVSLHRSEGWGLTMAEAMLLGKPVIATGYSGNLDFMDDANSLLVDYEIVALERDYPPYKAGARWADPSVDHAARLMRQVYENQSWARQLGAKARLDLRERMSIAASARRMAARLADIESTRRSGKPVNPALDDAAMPLLAS